MFRQVLKEVDMARDYLDYLIEESGTSAAAAADDKEGSEEDGPTFADVLSEKAAAGGGDVELFGGGGDAPVETPRETQYQPVLRSGLGNTVLLSGTVDATLLNILNNNFFGQELVPNFEFSKIKALVEDVGAAKKKAISREARYGGLLDKLVIEAASSSANVLPSKEELEGASSWIIQIDGGEDATSMLPKIAELAKDAASSELNHVVVLIAGASSSSTVDGWDAVAEASSDGESFKCTLLAVGELSDSGKEGGFYHVGQLGSEDAAVAAATMDAVPKISRKKAYQLLAHALALDCTSNQALIAYDYTSAAITAVATPYAEGEFVARDDDGNELVDEYVNVKMESRMIQAMREELFTQLMEFDVLVGKGLTSYKEYLENPPNKENAFSASASNVSKTKRDEEDERIMAMLDEEMAKTEAIKKDLADKAKAVEVEGIAKEWAIKEYSLRMLGGDLDDSVTENEFLISIQGEALVEADKTFERIHSVEYIKEQERVEKAKMDTGNKLFWDGMPTLLRKKREKMVEKVKKQYMDLLSEADLESIILNE